ncbi:hypothetical protein LL912_21905 [Niabella sp. CC-SYL272]|uniref:hypothetical protein n=1 Tax=Niabella agricola TaxID=2891571 RepID=UPI001F21AE48|nr:hypothetical protein [Niabella agricola]MCF3111456.1 hypothetical protein [Niabella agricola]
MQTVQSGRRIFLSNLALLTAGTLWGGTVSPLFSDNGVIAGPESTWEALCRRYKGAPDNRVLRTKKESPSCQGHTHREGPLMHFPEENIWAQPVWIYWANNKGPSDLIVHFYQRDNSVITLNQYELQALLKRGNEPSKNETGLLAPFLKINDNGLRAPVVQTTVYRNKIKTAYIS